MVEGLTNAQEPAQSSEPLQTAAPKTASEALRPAATAPVSAAPRRSRGSRNQIVVFMNFVMSLVVFMVLAAGASVYFGKKTFDGPGPSAAAQNFLIKPDTGTNQIAALLERNGVISNARIFLLGLRAYGGGETLKAGEYEIPAGASMREVMALLQSGKSIKHSVTIPEGLTVAQALRRIAEDEALSGDLPSPVPVEGSIAADTQTFTRGETRKDIVAKLAAQQKALVDAAWSNRAADLPLADVGEFVTLASIVEKETGLNDERARVASVFINRLRKNMRLQSDPTIIYGLFQGAGKPADRPIYQSDVEKKTPYNTYIIKGLPPTPIAIPGRAALEAVANPAQTDDLYFVADGTGGHVFAKTLDEHNRNVARYRAIQKQQEDDAKTGGQVDPAASPVDPAAPVNDGAGIAMTLQSMTGFSRAAGGKDGASFVWELRSVNGKTIDVRLRLPPGFDRLEQAVRQACQKRFSRGSIQVTLTVSRIHGSAVQPIVNEAFLKDLAGLAKRLEEQFGVGAARADGLLALRGVLEIPEAAETDDDRAATDAAILTVLDQAITGLAESRTAEGVALARLLGGHMDTIETLTANAEADPSRDPAVIRARLTEQVGLLMEPARGLDENRLYMEAALLAARADIREEIDRLRTHVASGRALLAAGGPVGRKLDFLAQEFNRESNTLCSKSNAATVTAIGLELKAVVDQFREQVQNLE